MKIHIFFLCMCISSILGKYLQSPAIHQICSLKVKSSEQICFGKYGKRCFSNYCGIDLNACKRLDYFFSAIKSSRIIVIAEHLKIYLDFLNSIKPCEEQKNPDDLKEDVCEIRNDCVAEFKLPVRKINVKIIKSNLLKIFFDKFLS